MDYEQTAKFLTTVGTSLAGLAAAYKWLPAACRKIRDSVEAKKSAAFVAGMRDLRALYNALERAQDYGATRGIIFEAHNSGGIPRINSPFYTSAVHWVSAEPEDEHRIASFIELPVDPAYVRMLEELQRTGFYHFITATESDCLLKRIYAASSVTSAAISSLGIIGNSYLYVSFARKEDTPFTPTQLTELQLIAGVIKSVSKVKQITK